MKRLISAAVWTVGVGAAAALAGPLNRAWVAADAKWVVHVDVEAAVASTMGKCVIAHKDELDIKPLKQFKKQTGLDPFEDIKGITVYGLSADADRGVAVVVGSARLEEAVNQMVAEDKSVQKLTSGDRTIYQWHEEGSDKFGYLTQGAGGKERVLVVSGSQEELKSALLVVEGAASLQGVTEGGMAAKARSGSVVFIAMRDIEDTKDSRGPKILRSAKELTADVGEDSDGVYGEVRLKAGAARDIKIISGYVNGILAIGRMAIQDEPDMAEAAKVLDGITIETGELDFTAKFRITKDQLASMVEQVNSGKGPFGKQAIEKPVSNPAAPASNPAGKER